MVNSKGAWPASCELVSISPLQMSAFEAWLWEVTSRIPIRARLRLADVVLDFIESHDATAIASVQLAAAGEVAASSGLQTTGANALMQQVILPPPAGLGRTKGRFVERIVASLSATSVVLPSDSEIDRASATSTATSMPLAQSRAPVEHGRGNSGARIVVPVLRLRAPAQLPVLRQALLLPSLRFRALLLFARFCDLGPEAVNLTLIAGTYDSIFKLLTATPARAPPPAAGVVDLAPILVFIWAKILGVDVASQEALVEAGMPAFFLEFVERMLDTGAAKAAASLSVDARSTDSGKVPPGPQPDAEAVMSSPHHVVQPAVTRISPAVALSLTARSANGESPPQSPASASAVKRAVPSAVAPTSGYADVIETDQTHHALFVLCKIMEGFPAGTRACWSPRAVRAAARVTLDDERALNRRWALMVFRGLAAGSDENRRALLVDGGDLSVRGEADSRAARAAAAAPVGVVNTTTSTSGKSARSAAPAPAPESLPAQGAAQPESALCWTPVSILLACAADDDTRIRTAATTALAALITQPEAASRVFADAGERGAAAALAVHAAEFYSCKLLVSATGSQAPGLIAKLAAVVSSLDPASPAPAALPPRLVGLPVNDMVAVSASDAYQAEFRASASLHSGAEGVASAAVTPNGYLRAAWAVACALVATSGATSMPSRHVFDRAAAAAAEARRSRRRVLLHAVARRMKRLLLSAAAVEEDEQITRQVMEQRPPALAALPVAAPSVVVPPTPTLWLPVIQAAGSDVPPGMLVAAVTPVSLGEAGVLLPPGATLQRVQSTGAMPKLSSLPSQNSIAGSQLLGTPTGRNPQVFFPDPTADGEYVTEAPPADFLAEALAAGAAAHRVGSTASDLSSAGSPMQRVESEDNVAALRGTGGAAAPSPLSPRNLTSRLQAQKPSPGRTVGHAAARHTPRHLRGPAPQTIVAPPILAAAVQRPGGQQATASPPWQNAPPPAPESFSSRPAEAAAAASPVRAAAESRRAARKAAGLRLSALHDEYGSLQAAAPGPLREACIAVCMAPMLQDACPAVRCETLVALAAFARPAEHELGLVVAVAASLIDYATGGRFLRLALRMAPHQVPQDGSSYSQAPRPLAGGSSLPTTPAAPESSAAALSSATRTAAARKHDAGSRLRSNFLSRLMGSGGQKPAAGAEASTSNVPAVSAPQSPGGATHPGHSATDFSALGFPDGLVTLPGIGAALHSASAALRAMAAGGPSGAAAKGVTLHEGAESRVGKSWLVAGPTGECDPVLQVSV